MNSLVVINSSDQDQSLGVAFVAAMHGRHWQIFEKVPFTYMKHFNNIDKIEEVQSTAKKDVEDSVYEAEWTRLNYLILISGQIAQILITQ